MLYQKDGPLRSSDYFFAKCYALILYFAGNLKCQGEEEEEGDEEEGGNFKFSFVCK